VSDMPNLVATRIVDGLLTADIIEFADGDTVLYDAAVSTIASEIRDLTAQWDAVVEAASEADAAYANYRDEKYKPHEEDPAEMRRWNSMNALRSALALIKRGGGA
jgi:hypothetical protein